MNRSLLSSAAIVLVLISAIPASAAGNPDETALIVNGDELYAWELRLLMPQIQNEMASQGRDTKGQDVLRKTLDRAIDSLLMAQEARRLGIVSNEARIEEKMKRLAEGAGGRAELEAELIKSQITYDQLRSTVVQADLVQTLVETEITSKIQVSEQDVEDYYTENLTLFTGTDKVHSRHIVFLVDPGATDAERETARQRAETARQRAVAGEDFAMLAVELSEGPNATRGGDLGITGRGQMVEAFDEAVWALDPGEISDVVESRLGYHVIKVEEFVEAPVVPLDEARQSVIAILRQQRTGAALGALTAELRGKAEIREPGE
jgi:peptidyl-prolyl cis-trans isomerase C